MARTTIKGLKVILYLLISSLIACQTVSLDTPPRNVKSRFVDLVYYSGSIDLYFVNKSDERRFRVSTEADIFPQLVSQLTEDSLDLEGPPSVSDAMIGRWFCIELEKNNIKGISLINKTEKCN